MALPATCGELVQGTLDGEPCLVSCPIDRFSLAEIRLWADPGWRLPPDAPKAAAAIWAALAGMGRQSRGGCLRLRSELPRGRGYGSSTADIGAALYALGWALDRPLAAAEVVRLATAIEPSDSTLLPGLALLDHRCGRWYRLLGPAPPLAVVVLDPGQEVDTLAFNRLDQRATLKRLIPRHREAFALLETGLRSGDWPAVGEAATLSARAHQQILPAPLLEPALALARMVGALGVCRAHSGSLLGLLLDPARADAAAVTRFVARRLGSRVAVDCRAVVNGGPYFRHQK